MPAIARHVPDLLAVSYKIGYIGYIGDIGYSEYRQRLHLAEGQRVRHTGPAQFQIDDQKLQAGFEPINQPFRSSLTAQLRQRHPPPP